jgi:glycerol-3-phosphate acyltransferase PlsY
MVGRWVRGVDIRKFGSGNIGFSNVLRVLGPGPASLVLVGDTLKGVIPVVVGRRLLVSWGVSPADLWVLAVALAAILGHSFSVFCGFRGGRAVATALGTLLGLCWPSALNALSMWLALVAATRYISLGSMVAALSVPTYMALAHRPPSWIAFWSAIALLIVVRHLPNIKRLLSGTETKIGQRVNVEHGPG